MKIIDALLNRQPPQPSPGPTSAFSNGPAVGQPVPVSLIVEPPSELSSGSDLNQAAIGAWPTLIDGGFKVKQAWRPNLLRNPYAVTVRGNMAGADSTPNWGFRFTAFQGIGSYPLEGFRPPWRNTYNQLIPIQYQIRVNNENTDSSSGYYNAPTGNQTKQPTATFIPSGTASLKGTGQTLL